MSNMDQELRLFNELRLHPWVPENKVKIDAWLARLAIEDPSHYERMNRQYAEKMLAHLEAQEAIVEVIEPVEPIVEPPVVAPIVEEPVIVEAAPEEPITLEESVEVKVKPKKKKDETPDAPEAAISPAE